MLEMKLMVASLCPLALNADLTRLAEFALNRGHFELSLFHKLNSASRPST